MTRETPHVPRSSSTSSGGRGSSNQPIERKREEGRGGREPVHLNSNEAHLGIYELKLASSAVLFLPWPVRAGKFLRLLSFVSFFIDRLHVLLALREMSLFTHVKCLLALLFSPNNRLKPHSTIMITSDYPWMRQSHTRWFVIIATIVIFETLNVTDRDWHKLMSKMKISLIKR